MAAIVAAPTPGIVSRRSLFCCEVWIALDTIGNLFPETIKLSIQARNMFSYGVFNGGVSRTKAVTLLGPHSDQGINSPHQ